MSQKIKIFGKKDGDKKSHQPLLIAVISEKCQWMSLDHNIEINS